jgi:hypothetical protein
LTQRRGPPVSAKVIAVTEFGEPRALWRPSPTRRVRTGDRLTVVATRDGLSGLTLGTDLLGLSGPSVSGRA